MTVQEILSFISDAGVVGLLIFIIVGGYKGVWVWGWQYREKVADAAEWRRLALEGTGLAEQAIGLRKRREKDEDRDAGS